jgi:hypothetical protein
MPLSRKRTLSEKWRLTSLSNKVITLATVVIAGAGVLTFGTAVLQWLEMHGAAKQTDRVIAADERLAGAMESSVAQAQKTLDASIKSFQLEQRAWVGVEGINGDIQLNKPYSILVAFRNSGKTPAKQVSLHMQFNPVRKGEALKFTYSEPISSQGFVPPNGTFTSSEISPTRGVPLGESEMELIKSGKLRAYLYGTVTYEDIFNRSHWMRFCYFIGIDAKSYTACDGHNDADEDKQQQPSDRKDEATTQPPTKPVIIVPENQTSSGKQGNNSAKAEMQQRREKPPWWDVTWSTWGLFGVGLGGTIAAIWTLVVVKRQGKDTKTTAEAALLNAKAIINAERAWIDAELIKKISMDVTQYDLEITNHGKTPARLCSYEINYGRPSEDGTWSLEALNGKFCKRIEIFLGSERSTTLPDFDIGKMFANLPDSSLRPQVVAGFIFFTISYADVVAIESEQIGGRETFFGYQYNVSLGSLERQPIFTRYT